MYYSLIFYFYYNYFTGIHPFLKLPKNRVFFQLACFVSGRFSTLEPYFTSLIRSITKLVLRFARFANQFSPLKLIEIQLIRSKSQKPHHKFCFCFLKQKT